MKVLSSAFAVLTLSCCLTAMAFAGTIEGTVTVKGMVPKAKMLDPGGDKKCAAIHKGKKIPAEEIVANGDKLQWVLVSVKKAPKGGKVPGPATIDQQGCRYTPHVLGLMKGQTLNVKNSDPLTHNIHPLPKINKEINLAQSTKGQVTPHKFDKVETKPFKVKCNIHKWMGAHIAVYDHPYFAVSGADGKFKIMGIPDGTYDLEFWHEKLGTKMGKVTVKGTGKADVTFDVK